MTDERLPAASPKLNKYRFVIAVMIDAEGVDALEAYHSVEYAWIDKQPEGEEITFSPSWSRKAEPRKFQIKRIQHVSTALVEAESKIQELEAEADRLREMLAEERNRPITMDEAVKRINVAVQEDLKAHEEALARGEDVSIEEIVRRRASRGKL